MGIGTFAMAPAELGVVAFPFSHDTLLCADSVWGRTGLAYIGLISTDSFTLLVLLWIFGGVMFSFFPILMTQVFNLLVSPEGGGSGIGDGVHRPVGRRGGGANTGGICRTEYRDLGLGLFISAFAPLTLVATALLLAGYRRERPVTGKADRMGRLRR